MPTQIGTLEVDPGYNPLEPWFARMSLSTFLKSSDGLGITCKAMR